MSGPKMLVTTVQENCICKTKVHLLVFNIFYALLGYLDRYISVAVLSVTTPVSCSARLHLPHLALSGSCWHWTGIFAEPWVISILWYQNTQCFIKYCVQVVHNFNALAIDNK